MKGIDLTPDPGGYHQMPDAIAANWRKERIDKLWTSNLIDRLFDYDFTDTRGPLVRCPIGDITGCLR